MDECERALRVLTVDAPTVVATDDCAACCDLRLVETTRTIAMRARVRESFRLGARLARSESERKKLAKTADDAVVTANDANTTPNARGRTRRAFGAFRGGGTARPRP